MATSREWAQVIAQAWLDEEFKDLLEKDPAAALKQHGIETDVVRPVPPRPSELKDEHLEADHLQESIYNKLGKNMTNNRCEYSSMFNIGNSSLIKKETNLLLEIRSDSRKNR